MSLQPIPLMVLVILIDSGGTIATGDKACLSWSHFHKKELENTL